MLATVGDLVEDVVVRLDGPVNIASDTPARVRRRRGGSAANAASTAARIGRPARFLGQVGHDPTGAALIDELRDDGVDVSAVRRGGATGTIVVLVDDRGERTMLTDRGACLHLREPDPAWLDGVTALHVPWYSLTGPPLSATTATLVEWAHDRDIAVSIDLSSASILRWVGAERVHDRLVRLAPTVVFANSEEAAVVGVEAAVGDALTVVKRGPEPVLIMTADERLEVPVPGIGPVVDTTGAGDAFAAGFLTFDDGERASPGRSWQRDPAGAASAGCDAALTLLSMRRP